MATGDTLVTLDGLKAVYTSVERDIQTEKYALEAITGSKTSYSVAPVLIEGSSVTSSTGVIGTDSNKKRTDYIPTFGGNTITYPVYGYSILRQQWMAGTLDTEENTRKFLYEIQSMRKASALFDEGCDLLLDVLERIPERKRAEATRIYGIARFMANAAKTAANAKDFFYRKKLLEKTDDAKTVNRLLDEIQEICRAELENATATIPLVEFDSALGFEPSMEYMCDAAHLEWKIALLNDVIEKEIPSLYRR